MKDIKRIQEYNRCKIICAVHGTEDYEEALKEELGFGCRVINHLIPFVQGSDIEDDFVDFISDTKYRILTHTEPLHINNLKSIIGKPLTLDRVLLASEDFWLFNRESKNLLKIEDGIIWNLTKQTLEEQDFETQFSVFKLLGGI